MPATLPALDADRLLEQIRTLGAIGADAEQGAQVLLDMVQQRLARA